MDHVYTEGKLYPRDLPKEVKRARELVVARSMDMIILEGWWHPGQPLDLTSRQLLKERFGYLVC
jgi:hypothetical protein